MRALGDTSAAIVPVSATPPSTTNTILNGILWGAVAVGIGAMFFWIIQGPKVNPTRGSGGPKAKRRRRSIPIVKGRSCRFEMKEGPDVTCGGGMIHDPTGRAWPKNSVAFGPVRRVRSASGDEFSGAGRHYLGGSYKASIGIANLPPRGLDGWRYLGEVERIYYTRTGRKNGGVRFQHPFSKPGALATIVKGKGKARLYRRGRWCRLELPRGAILDSRGYVWP
jgi:hypothetical protein